MDELKHQGLIEAKAVLKYVKATASSFIVMKPVDTEKMVIVTFGDAAFANAPSNKSQGGYVTVACTEDSLQGEGDASLLDWKSYWHQRVLRSTLAAEAASLDRAEDGANFVSAFTGELFLPGYVASRSGKSLFPIWPVTHARSLYDAIHRLATSFAEKRVEIDIAALRQCCRSLRWVPTEVMLADGFTKRSRALRDKLRRWQEDPKISLTEARDAHDEDVQGPQNQFMLPLHKGGDPTGFLSFHWREAPSRQAPGRPSPERPGERPERPYGQPLPAAPYPHPGQPMGDPAGYPARHPAVAPAQQNASYGMPSASPQAPPSQPPEAAKTQHREVEGGPRARLGLSERGRLEANRLMSSKDSLRFAALRPFNRPEMLGRAQLTFAEFKEAFLKLQEETVLQTSLYPVCRQHFLSLLESCLLIVLAEWQELEVVDKPNDDAMRKLFQKHSSGQPDPKTGTGSLGREEYEALLFRMLTFMLASGEVEVESHSPKAGEERDKRWREEFLKKNSQRFQEVYLKGRKLGEGSFGAVYEVAHRSNETSIRVCKVIQKSSADKERGCIGNDCHDAKTSHQRVREEFAVLKRLDHPHVAPWQSCFLSNYGNHRAHQTEAFKEVARFAVDAALEKPVLGSQAGGTLVSMDSASHSAAHDTEAALVVDRPVAKVLELARSTLEVAVHNELASQAKGGCRRATPVSSVLIYSAQEPEAAQEANAPGLAEVPQQPAERPRERPEKQVEPPVAPADESPKPAQPKQPVGPSGQDKERKSMEVPTPSQATVHQPTVGNCSNAVPTVERIDACRKAKVILVTEAALRTELASQTESKHDGGMMPVPVGAASYSAAHKAESVLLVNRSGAEVFEEAVQSELETRPGAATPATWPAYFLLP
eukprot:g19812.t1